MKKQQQKNYSSRAWIERLVGKLGIGANRTGRTARFVIKSVALYSISLVSLGVLLAIFLYFSSVKPKSEEIEYLLLINGFQSSGAESATFYIGVSLFFFSLGFLKYLFRALLGIPGARLKLYSISFLYVGSIWLLPYLIEYTSKGIYFTKDGEVFKCYTMSPVEGLLVELKDLKTKKCPVNQATGLDMKPITLDIVDSVRATQKNVIPKEIQLDAIEEREFFGIGKKPKVYFSEIALGAYRYFDGPGYDTYSGVMLKPVTSENESDLRNYAKKKLQELEFDVELKQSLKINRAILDAKQNIIAGHIDFAEDSIDLLGAMGADPEVISDLEKESAAYRYETAKSYFSEENYIAAEQELNHISSNYKRMLGANELLAHIAINNEMKDVAAAIFRAENLLARGRKLEAKSYVTKILERFPGNSDAKSFFKDYSLNSICENCGQVTAVKKKRQGRPRKEAKVRNFSKQLSSAAVRNVDRKNRGGAVILAGVFGALAERGLGSVPVYKIDFLDDYGNSRVLIVNRDKKVRPGDRIEIVYSESGDTALDVVFR